MLVVEAVDFGDVVVVEAVELGSLGFAGEDGNVHCGIGAGCTDGDGRCGRQLFGYQPIGFWPFNLLFLWFQGSPSLGLPSLHHGKDSRTFAVAGLGLCPCLWLHYCRGLAAEGIHDDEQYPQSVVDWQCCAPGTGRGFASLSPVTKA